MRILALDTATESCSIALLADGSLVGRELELGHRAAEHILPMIDGLLSESGLALGLLDAIAFGRGPGGFTGVRLAASVAQGLAFGAGLPVVPVSDLAAVAQRVLEGRPEVARVIVCNDARMQEVYWGCFARGPEGLAAPVGEESVGKPATVAIAEGWLPPIVGAGRGFAAYPELWARLGEHLSGIQDQLLPRAHEIALLALPVLRSGGAVRPEEALPVYLRDDVARPARETTRRSRN